MKKKQIICIIAFIFLALIVPKNAVAQEVSTEKVISRNLLSVGEKTEQTLVDIHETISTSYKVVKVNNTQNTDGWMDDYDQPQSCTGSSGLLGSYDDPDSVAWLLQKLFNYLKILGPFIVVIMSGIDFAKVIVMGDDDGMKKAQSKLITRLILAASLFFLPDLVSAMLELFGITSSGICGLE